MTEQKTNWQTLLDIQQELRVPKGQYNDFGKYKYRSCEDILEAVKPILAEHGATITLTDELVLIGERYYIKATATLHTGAMPITATAYAREDEEKRGMSAEQVTGSCSSYARKYALSALLLLDDTKDADTNEQHVERQAKSRQIRKETGNKGKNAPDGNGTNNGYFCEVCGKEVSEGYALKSIAKVGHIFCSAECKADWDAKEKEE